VGGVKLASGRQMDMSVWNARARHTHLGMGVFQSETAAFSSSQVQIEHGTIIHHSVIVYKHLNFNTSSQHGHMNTDSPVP
jgi:hypothetical protein